MKTSMTTLLAGLAVTSLVTSGVGFAPAASAEPLYECAPARVYCPTSQDADLPNGARGVDGGRGGARLPTGDRPQTLWIGDSLSKRAAPAIAQQRPGFYVDYQGGRPVKAANQLIERFVTKVNPRPRNLVFALGTNNSPGIWSKARLRAAVAKVPASTRIYFILAVRPKPSEREKDRNLQRYNRWNAEIARERPRTHLVGWRRAVLTDPTLDRRNGRSDLLEDGVHQTGSAFGRQEPGRGIDTLVRLFLREMKDTGGLR